MLSFLNAPLNEAELMIHATSFCGLGMELVMTLASYNTVPLHVMLSAADADLDCTVECKLSLLLTTVCFENIC